MVTFCNNYYYVYFEAGTWLKDDLPIMRVVSSYDTWQCLPLGSGRFGPSLVWFRLGNKISVFFDKYVSTVQLVGGGGVGPPPFRECGFFSTLLYVRKEPPPVNQALLEGV